jgi:hypothetical protein
MAGVIMAMGGAGDAPVADLPAPYTRPDAEALRSEGYLDTGPFLFTEDGSGEPVLGHSPREGFSALLVADEPLLVGETGRVIPRVYGPGLTVGSVAVRFEGELYTVELSRVRVSSTRLDGVARVEPLSDGELLISASAIEVPEASPADRGVLYDSTPTRQPVNHRATLSADGHLWLDPEAIAPGTATDEWTGALLDTAGAIEAGAVDPVAQFMLFTSCRGGVCSVSWRPALPPRAPIAGTLTCESSTRLRLDGTEVSLRFEWANTGYGGHPQLDCAPREVEAGEEIGPVRHWVITAYDRGGRQMSLAVSRDGRLFAGEFGPTVGCPCRSGN